MNAELAALELEDRRRNLHRFVAKTFPNFSDGWFYQHLCNELREFMLAVRRGEEPRLIVNVPPRHGKSEICSVRFPLWCLLNNPDWEVIVSSYSQPMADRFSRKARALIADEYVQDLWGEQAMLARDQANVHEWKVGHSRQGGTYRAVGRGAGVTGTGAHVFIGDDLLKDNEEADSPRIREHLWDWYTSTARTRMAPGGGMLIIQTRWHTDDLTGKLLKEQEAGNGEHWRVVEYAALAEKDEAHRPAGEALHPPRFTAAKLGKLRDTLPTRWWLALYQQRPISAGGETVKEAWFKRYKQAPDLNECDEVIQVWDLRTSKSQAATSSWVVGIVLARQGANIFLVAEERGRWGYVDSRDAIERLSAAYPQALAKIIENKANGPAIEDDLHNDIPGILLWNPRGDKLQRLERVVPMIRAGNVHIPEDEAEPWVKDWLAEVSAFPNGAADDRVDTLSMGLAYFHERAGALDDLQFI